MADKVEGPIEVENKELLTPRDFRREFASRLEELTSGEVEKLVLLQRNQMVAVVLPVEEYRQLLLYQMRPGRVGVEIDAYADSDD